ncbi:hypothetical protein H0H87_000838 [Tephrocybe sp. NHM501043]|nr:hypothetical protein H0H87_000838 [Tephrocybe sp. NHM501043]
MDSNVMASELNRSSLVGQNSRNLRLHSVTVPSPTFLSLPNPPSLKRKKSFDSASTGSAVTAPDDIQESGVKTLDQETTPRPFIIHRKSRSKIGDQRSIRFDRDTPARETIRKSASMGGSEAGSSRREHSYDHAIASHSRKDKGKAIDRLTQSSAARLSLTEFMELTECERAEKHAYSGPLAHAEFERMRKEIEVWKKAAADNKRQAKKQAKKIEGLKAQILAETLLKNERESQVKTLKAKVEKKDEAPPGADDDDVDPDEFEDDPDYILHRAKSCPCCRAVVIRRPIPVFLVKSLATAVSKHKEAVGAGPSTRGRSPSPLEDDPWRGLFYSTDEDSGDIFEETSDEDEVYEDAIGWAMHGLQMSDMRHQFLRDFDDAESESGSDFEVDEVFGMEEDDGDAGSVNSYDSDEYESVYVPTRWEPPTVAVDPEPYVLRNQGISASLLPMLRRGCTVDMIRLFAITYSHAKGLVAHLPSLDEDFADLSHLVVERNNRVFLGWNVHPDGEDYTGELYMQRLLADMRENSNQWMWTERTHSPGAFDVKLMVKVEDVEHYDTTDTEDWLANDSYL